MQSRHNHVFITFQRNKTFKVFHILKNEPTMRGKCIVMEKYQVSLLSCNCSHFLYVIKHAHLENKPLDQQRYQLLRD